MPQRRLLWLVSVVLAVLIGLVVVCAGSIAIRAARNRAIVHSLLMPDDASVYATCGKYTYAPPPSLQADGLSLVLGSGQRVHGFSVFGQPSRFQLLLISVFGRHACTDLFAVYWENPSVTDMDLRRLAQVPNLRELHLDHASITDAGIPSIVALHQLTVLDLSSTQVTNGGIAQLAACSNLRELDLSNTPLDDDLADQLQMALPDCVIVR